MYFAVDDDGRIYFGADQATLKSQHLRVNPSIAAAFSDDGASCTGLQIRGNAEELTDRLRIRLARDLLKKRDERAAAFFDNPDVIFFEVNPEEKFLINFAWGVDWRNAVPA